MSLTSTVGLNNDLQPAGAVTPIIFSPVDGRSFLYLQQIQTIMFLFGKKKETVKVTDIVFMQATARWQACIDAHQKDPNIILIAWFEETQRQLLAYITRQNAGAVNVYLYRQATSHLIYNRQAIFVEHYPLREKETTLFTSLHLKEATILSSLDEPLFQYFGGTNIKAMMERMGMKENEPIQHSIITTAIKNAQGKIAKKVAPEQSATSQRNWFEINLEAGK